MGLKKVKFEDAIKELEDLIGDLENGELTLDQALEAFQRGIELSRICANQLDGAEQKIDLLLKEKDGNITLKPVDFDNCDRE